MQTSWPLTITYIEHLDLAADRQLTSAPSNSNPVPSLDHPGKFTTFLSLPSTQRVASTVLPVGHILETSLMPQFTVKPVG